jgi:hypothetical protein
MGAPSDQTSGLPSVQELAQPLLHGRVDLLQGERLCSCLELLHSRTKCCHLALLPAVTHSPITTEKAVERLW